jgi:TonB family protein
MMVQVEPDDRMPPSGRARILVEVNVTKNGVPVRVRIIQSSGIRDLDEQVLREFQVKRYLPALLEGVPIDGVFRNDGYSPMR